MSYDALAESVRLLDGARLPDVARLSRRIRHLPLAVDRDGEVAVTMFLRRGVSGVPLVETHVLARTGGTWRVLGGGGGPAYAVLEPRQPLADLGAPAVSHGGGGVASSGDRPWRRSDWISYAELEAAAEVAALRVGSRLLPVPGHGCAIVVWRREPPAVDALDASGAVLGAVDLNRPPGGRAPGRRSPA
ncbi:hypothetical protein ACI78T_17115 [Blastococcus sp. SYSU D00922]